uniref:Nuclear segregation protein Bfr1 n=1 Tax=Alexandrium monilatum TaxID=311494 RepID=A0A7S4W2P8_9DINO
MAPKAKAAAAAPAAKAEPKAKAKADSKKKEKSDRPKPEDEIPKVDSPDKDEYDAKIKKIGEEIEALSGEQRDLQAKINERSSGKEQFFAQKLEFRKQLDALSEQMNVFQERKDEINKAVGDKVQEGREMRQQLNKMKKSIGYSSESEIDDRIASIEFKLWTDSLTLKEEKKYLQEIQELKRNRPKVSQVNQMEQGLQTFDKGSALKGDISSINEEMFKLREQKRAVSEKLKELTEGRKEQEGDLGDIYTKKADLGKQIAEKVKERNQIRDDFRAAEKDYREYQAKLRSIRVERQNEQRRAWEAEQDAKRKQQKAEKLDEQPHVAEITLIEQTILFCKSLTQSKGSDAKEEKKETVIESPEGTQVLLKKEERDEFYFAPTAKKKGKSGKKSGGSDSSKKPIKHNAETFRLFDQLKLDAPITTDDIPATLEKLEEKLEFYQAKVKKWEETKEIEKRKIYEGQEAEEEEEPEKKGDEEKEKEEEEEKKDEKEED